MTVRLGLLCLLASAAVSCQKSESTFALLKFQGSVPAGRPIHSIKVDLQLAAHTDSAAFAAAAGSAITLPTTGVLEIRSGTGDLAVVATAMADDGSPLATGNGSGRVTSGQTATISVIFGTGVVDAGVDSAGSLEAGAERPSGDSPIAQGGVDGGATTGGGGSGGAGGSSVPGTGGSRLGTGGTAGATVVASGGASTSTGGATSPASGGSGGTTVISAGGAIGSDAGLDTDAPSLFVIALSASTIDLGMTLVGGVSPPQSVTVTNTGSVVGPPLTIFINDGHHFPLSQDRCSGARLAPGGSCTLAFTFNPDAPGPVRTDAAVSGGNQRVTFYLSGIGQTPPSTLNLSPQSVDFMFVDLGITPAVNFTVTNKASTDSGAIKISASPTASFKINNDQCAQTTLGPQGQCTFLLVFTPQAIGPVSGTIMAESATSSATSTATGTGQDHVQLVIQFAGTGGGSVSGPNLNCRSAAGNCSMGFVRTNPNSWPGISLSPAPNALSVFAGWSGAGCSGTGSCVVTMDASKTVTATFNTQ